MGSGTVVKSRSWIPLGSRSVMFHSPADRADG